MFAPIAIFAATYLVMAIGKLPGYQLDRAGAALLGASLMIWSGVLSLDEAFQSIDLETIALLLGMMIVVANLRLSGFFEVVNDWVVARARHPLALLCGIVLVSGALSAFLVNDAICLVLTPPVLDLAKRLERDPTPYLLADPHGVERRQRRDHHRQSAEHDHRQHLAYSVRHLHRRVGARRGRRARADRAPDRACLSKRVLDARATRLRHARSPDPLRSRPLALKSVLVTAAMVILFFAGEPVAKVAILGGGLLLLTRRVKPEKVYLDIDWPLLVMFIGLFIVVAGAEKSLLDREAIAAVARLDLAKTPVLSVLTALLSNLVSNVPAVLVLKPFVASLADPQRAWLVVAMASTLAGNLTLVGSVANLIVAQRARSRGIEIGFWAYFRVGAPLTMLTILFGILWI